MSDYFQDQGTLPPDAPSYVERPADEKLFQLCNDGKLCYVLAPRQTGKSSLVARTRRRLNEAGIRSVYIDLTALGSRNPTPAQWYLSLLTQIHEKLKLDIDLEAWWQRKRHLTVVKRFSAFLGDETLQRIDGRLVVFFDEIDSTLRMPFSADDFFAALRAMVNARAMEPALERLTLVLLGVASPSDLIADPKRTPFNIGTAVELDDLELTDKTARVLLGGLNDGGDPQAILERIFHWTDGHPRLTQLVCLGAVGLAEAAPENIDAVVADSLIGPKGDIDSTLFEVRRQAQRDPRARRWLQLYSRVLRDRGPQVDAMSEDQTRLRLVGLVKGRPGERLRVRNRIFATVFDTAWTTGLLRSDPVRKRTRIATAAAILVAVTALPLIRETFPGRTDLPSNGEEAVIGPPDQPPTTLINAINLLFAHTHVDPEKVLSELRALEPHQLAAAFDRGPTTLPEERRAEAVLNAATLALPLIRESPQEMATVGAIAWAIDYFAAREGAFAERANRLRANVLQPLRKHVPPSPQDFEWVDVPGGDFYTRFGDDGPSFNRGTMGSFRILATEVTNEQFQRLVSDHRGDVSLPAVNVDWYQAYAFAAWLGGRLPTDAEWEYAARANCRFDYCDRTGEEVALKDVGWYRDHPSFRNSPATLQPAKRLEPNPWGLYDMYGNVWEWVADWDGPRSFGPGVDPWGPPIASGDIVGRVYRGGAFGNSAGSARADARARWVPDFRRSDLGFRVVLPLSVDVQKAREPTEVLARSEGTSDPIPGL